MLLDVESMASSAKCSRMWMLGVAIYILAAVPDVLSYILVPQVICSAVACFRLVIVAIMAYAVLGEKSSVKQFFGMMGCTIGTFMCLCFGPVRMGKAAMVSGFDHPYVTMYLVAGGVVGLFLLTLDHLDDFSSKCSLSARCRCFTLPLITGLAFAISKVYNTMIGFITTPHMDNVLLHPQWIAMAIAIALLGLTDLYLNLRATRLMPVQIFVPVSFAWSTVLLYFQSVVLFAEFHDLPGIKAALSMTGAIISLLGALCIQLSSSSTSPNTQKVSDGILNGPSNAGVDLEYCTTKAVASESLVVNS